MGAISVREGLLHVDPAALPDTGVIEKLTDILDGMNQRLRRGGEVIESSSDLQRVMELYGESRLDVPQVGSTSDFRAARNQPAPISTEGNRIVTTRNTAALNYQAYVSCPPSSTKANWPHESETTSGNIIGKGQVTCSYLYGPPQTISYDAYVFLQKLKAWWIWAYWKHVGTTARWRETGNYISIPQHLLVAVAPCDSGTFRTGMYLYITGSTLGRFYPYPGFFGSQARRVSC